jgi:predicted exporter
MTGRHRPSVTRRGAAAILLWLLGLAASIAIVASTPFTTDMSAFLPHAPKPAQQVLVDQLHDGVASRLILIGIEGADAAARAALSQAVATGLRRQRPFVLIDNGDGSIGAPDQAYVWRNRYLLSPDVTPARFSAAGLKQQFDQDLQLLSSGMEPLLKDAMAEDPTGETLALARMLAGTQQRTLTDGVWTSSDGRRALILAETAAPGFDIDAQEIALTAIRTGFAAARASIPGAGAARLLATGPGVFGVETRAEMKHDVTLYSSCAVAAIVALLLLAYRSPLVLVLTLLPVLSGALAGLVAVRLCFGFVHGVTLGFGVTLIGEAVDYTIYLFAQTDRQGNVAATLSRIWPTLRLGVSVSVCGFAAMLFSSFTGFEQLGIFTITGLLTALAITRFVLPHLVPARFQGTRELRLAGGALRAMQRARVLRLPLAALTLCAVVLVLGHRGSLWQADLSSLSPISAADQRLDRTLRQDIGAPDVRYVTVVAAASGEAALEGSEWAGARLRNLVAEGALADYDAPDRYLPSLAMQQARRAAIPDRNQLQRNLAAALAGLPFDPGTFQPFVAAATAARNAPPLTRRSLDGTALSLKLDTLLVPRAGQWFAILPLHGVRDPAKIGSALADPRTDPTARITLLDLKAESDLLLQRYQHEALTLACFGTLAIALLLLIQFRSMRESAVVLAPLAVAVILTVALLTIGGRQLSIFNLFGLLLVVAVGSNYCLFFQRGGLAGPDGARTALSLLLANLCTVIGFGALSMSRLPVLNGLGDTVAIGTALSLAAAAILTPQRAGGHAP